MPLYIGVATVLVFPSVLPAQSAPVKTESEMSTQMVLETEMTATELQPARLQSFNNRAEQKLEDFAEVLTLLGNEEVEMELRREVAKAAFGFFQNENIILRWYDLRSEKIIEPALGSLLEKTISENSGVKVQVSNISGEAPVTCPPPSCSWDLNFRIVQKPEKGAAISLHATMTVVLEKREKYFGDAKKEVWEVFLGEIKKMQFRP